MKSSYGVFLFLLIILSTNAYSEVVICTKDYSNSDLDPAYRLKDLQIKFEKYFPGTSMGALKAKG